MKKGVSSQKGRIKPPRREERKGKPLGASPLDNSIEQTAALFFLADIRSSDLLRAWVMF